MKKWLTVIGLLLFLAACGDVEENSYLAPSWVPAVTSECTVWDASTTYNGGSTVTFEGQGYEAKWWTKNENPTQSGEWGVWKTTDACDGAGETGSDTGSDDGTDGGTTDGGTTDGTDGGADDGGDTGTDGTDGGADDGGTDDGGTDDGGSDDGTDGGSPPTDPNTDGYVRVGYFVQWGIYARDFTLADMDKNGAAETLTHLNYAFGGITPSGECTVTYQGKSDSFADYGKAFPAEDSVDGVADTWDQPLKGNFNQIKELKAKHPGLQALISLGGWTWSDFFSDVALTDAARKKFVSSCIDIYIKGNLPESDGAGGPGAAAGVFDGIDIDWEYPAAEGNAGNIVRPEDTRNFSLLLEEFRTQLDAIDEDLLLTAALPAAPQKIAKLEVPEISKTLDLLNIMTYDLRGAFNAAGPTNFHANLYPDPASPGEAGTEDWSVETAVDTFLRAGAPAKKLVVGVPYYGRGWKGVASDNNGLYQSANGGFQGEYEMGIDNYKVIINQPGEVYRHAPTKSLWKYDGDRFWSYDDPEVLTDKMAYIKERGLGGSMAWSMDGEDAGASLSKTIYQELR